MVKTLIAGYTIEEIDAEKMMLKIEEAGRTCYKSEGLIAPGSASELVKKLIRLGHESVLEHEKISVRVVCDRGVTHEIVRHRLASYSQESTRYCNYSGDKHGNEISVIDIFHIMEGVSSKDPEMLGFKVWETAQENSEKAYMELINLGYSPQIARSVLTNSLKTEIVITQNLRQWRHFFSLRASKRAHPQMQEIAYPMLEDFKSLLPDVFHDL